MGLAFGLGGRETAAKIVANWYEKSRTATPMRAAAARAAGVHETPESMATTETVESDPTNWPTGGYPGPGSAPANRIHGAEGG